MILFLLHTKLKNQIKEPSCSNLCLIRQLAKSEGLSKSTWSIWWEGFSEFTSTCTGYLRIMSDNSFRSLEAHFAFPLAVKSTWTPFCLYTFVRNCICLFTRAFSSASLSFSGSERITIAVSLFWRPSTVVIRISVFRSSIAAAIFLPFLFLFRSTWLDIPSSSQEVA